MEESKIVERFILKTDWESYISEEKKKPPRGLSKKNFLKMCDEKAFWTFNKNDYYRIIVSMHLTGM